MSQFMLIVTTVPGCLQYYTKAKVPSFSN